MPNLQEIKNAVFSLNQEAPAGPDGFPAIFYTSCWEIIKDDLLEAIQDFFQGAELPLGFSATSIALIPKIKNPSLWSDFRPISLCNCSHKIVSKLLNERLSTTLTCIISDN